VAFVGKRRPELGLDNTILDYGELNSLSDSRSINFLVTILVTLKSRLAIVIVLFKISTFLAI
jgi:hypothetical protein